MNKFREAISIAAGILREVAPIDLAEKPIYRYEFAELAGSGLKITTGACAGFTSPLLDVQLEGWLSSRGQFDGRGFFVVIDSDSIIADCQKSGALLSDVVTAVFLHELGHWIEGRRYSLPAIDELPAKMARRIDPLNPDDLDAEFAEQKLLEQTTPWLGHEWEFVLVCCHLEIRARLHAPPGVNLNFRYAGSHYGLSPKAKYLETVRDEAYDRRDDSLFAILDDGPNSAFARLYLTDMGAWKSRHASPPAIAAAHTTTDTSNA